MKLIVSLFFLFFATSAYCEDINITADKKVEWHQKTQKMVAIGNAVASKGGMSIKSNTLTGYYQGGNKQTKGKIKQVIANGNVKMHTPRADAFGDNLDYNLETDTAILIGNPAQIKTDKETISAQKNITYYPSEQKAVAIGNVSATDKQGNQIFSDKMVAYFKKDKSAEDSMSLDKVNIFGNIKIITPDAEVTADKGSYLPSSGLVKLFNNVIINQQGNILKGDKAETNLNTGISKLIAKDKQSKVMGVFKEKKQ